MDTVTKREEIIQNLQTLENYLCEGSEEEIEFAMDLIRRGRCFITYQVNNEIRFSPSRFSGYKDNDMNKHNEGKVQSRVDGKETNPAISNILNTPLEPNEQTMHLYLEYCQSLGVTPVNLTFKKFWNLNSNEAIVIEDEKESTSFPEGAIVERIHLRRERDNMVVKIAKENFKKKHGKLFCQICDFDFESTYGDHGKDFIEAHHTIPVSEMRPNHRTKPEDIAMVCSNCHEMIHRKRPWLSIDKLKEILK